jgi:Gas vesicle synthesis protein GvpL/GvpF
MSLRLYAFVSPAPAHLVAGVTGVEDECLALVRAQRIAAVVGACESDPSTNAISRRALQRHDRVVRELARRAKAVVPARFGVHTGRAGDVRDFIRSRHDALRSALELVRDREQMTVRISRRKGTRAAPASSRKTSAGPGRTYLLSRVAQPLSVLPELSAAADLWAAHVHAERGQRPRQGPLLTIFHLIDRGTCRAYRRVLREAGATVPHLELHVSGPFPPYGFAPWL